MGVTAIKLVQNNSPFTVVIHNSENPQKFLNGGTIDPFSEGSVDMWVPWANPSWGAEIERHHITLRLQDRSGVAATYRIFQHATVDGDFVRAVRWGEDDGRGLVVPGNHYNRIHGFAEVNGDRKLMVAENGTISLERIS